MKIHIVQQGDTLWNIAKKYNVDFQALKAANTQLANPDMLMPGMKIKVPTESKQVSQQGSQAPTAQKGAVKEPFKHVPQKAHPVVKEDDHKPKKEVVKKAPQKQVTLPKLPPVSIQMPKLPNIYSNHYNIDVDIEDNDTIIKNKTYHHHPKPTEKKEEVKAEVKKPVQKPAPMPQPVDMIPCPCYVWMPCAPQQWNPMPYAQHETCEENYNTNEYEQYQDANQFYNSWPQAHYQYPTQTFDEQQQWGDVDLEDEEVNEQDLQNGYPYPVNYNGYQHYQNQPYLQQDMQQAQMNMYGQPLYPTMQRYSGYADPYYQYQYPMTPWMAADPSYNDEQE
ncbi:morphogenetic protein associated with SpoVID [Amphibacillus marinus]|uniref:Morphogenetic protein associated with SpoVID n=1 Tax=Amphibacillus marinus TaxID=872970 RepID=A0A1H8P1P7_9BACI|nr:SafA/ExsA family spore coat assembly protein [Amphibacillus marinus]SEO35528.1 morphogenetic protein associated with SpoVID [Amphibacillus marinus]